MKYICLGYFDEKKWEAMSEREQHTFMDDCFAYDDLLRKNGHIIGGEALKSSQNAITLRWKNGKVSITDGPYAETKEQLGGFGVLEVTDLNHAIQLMSKHPGVQAGPCEIRPAEDLTEMIHESEQIKMLRDKNIEKSERVISNDKVANAWGPCTGIVWTKSFTLKFQRKGPDLTSWSTLESVRRKHHAIHADVLLRREAVGRDSRITARRDHAGVRRVRAEPRQ